MASQEPESHPLYPEPIHQPLSVREVLEMIERAVEAHGEETATNIREIGRKVPGSAPAMIVFHTER